MNRKHMYDLANTSNDSARFFWTRMTPILFVLFIYFLCTY